MAYCPPTFTWKSIAVMIKTAARRWGHRRSMGVCRTRRAKTAMERLSQKLLSWASICDDATREQALRTSTMPFIYPHMALMSDCHLGKGATVGSVIPTLGAIIPAAVGVDIGCFHGDTRVPLLNGRQRSLRDLAEGVGPDWVYSMHEPGQIAPALATPLRTRPTVA